MVGALPTSSRRSKIFLPATKDDYAPLEAPRLAFVGRPNVGKSSLISKILDNRRAIVSHIPGTTRGMRSILPVSGMARASSFATPRGSAIAPSITHLSRSLASCGQRTRSNGRICACLSLTQRGGVTAQDKKIAGLIQKARKAALVALNKWDLVSSPGQSDSELLRKHVGRAPRSCFSSITPRSSSCRREPEEPAKAVYDDRKDSPACNASDRHGRVEPSVARCDGTSPASPCMARDDSSCYTPHSSRR